MRKYLSILLLFVFSTLLNAHGGGNYEHINIFKSMKDGDKAAILLVHFGTTHHDTREKTIDAIKIKVETQFAEVEVREAFTSRIVIKRLNDKGIKKQNPLQALNQLHTEEYTHILIQPSTIIDGVEMESLVKNVETAQSQFKDIRVGNPLLYEPADYENLINILAVDTDQNTAYVFVGHGTPEASTAQYAMLDYMLKAKGHKNCIVGTIEGYPSYDDMLNQLKESKLKKVMLIPLMFVAGDHAKNDIAGDWKDALEEAGFKVDVRMQGLGENPKVQDLYVDHLNFIVNHKKREIIAKKAIYEVTGEVMD